MIDELSIIPSEVLTNVSKTEVNELINELVEKSKNNMEEICELTVECTTLLASSESKSKALSNQGVFKRLVGSITGKNQKLQSAILQDNSNALYAAQEIINRVMLECTYNRKLLLAVNDRVSDLYLELKENQNDMAATVLMTRQAIVAFYKKYQENILAQDKRINRIEEYAKVRCPKCQSELLSWQKVCPYCGYIHPLKVEGVSDETNRILSQISNVIKDNEFSEDIIWDLTAKKTERVLRKVKTLAEIGKLPGYTEELNTDVENLIAKCKDAEFQIAVVGVMKAGKSFLMNALIGAEIASVEVNPETAALTKFRSANGYYVIVKFHSKTQWEKLRESAKNSKKAGKDSLVSRLGNPETKKMESEWVNHKEIKITCQNLEDLQEPVKKFTSSQTMEHLFVSEVEVGVDKSIFNMPKEVVFVDTPGLKDPVKYRSDITRKYIKKADAVLIALKPGPFTAEGLEIVTTVLDCTETDKAYIVGTQKDLNNETDCEKYVNNWVEHLVNAKRYSDERKVRNRIILTSAKMDLLVNRWHALSEKEKENEECFSVNDYNDLENYSAKVIQTRRFNLVQMSEENFDRILDSTGISVLRNKLESSLIMNYRKLKMEDIKRAFIRCKKQISTLSKNAIEQKENSIELAMVGVEALNSKLSSMNGERERLRQEGQDLKRDAEKLENVIRNKIKLLEGKGY